MKFNALYLLIYSFLFLISTLLSAQSSDDSMKNAYSKKLIGTWAGQIEMIEKRVPLADTTVFTYDTLMISSDNSYYLSQGGNTAKHWVGFVSTGTWEINLRPVAYLQLYEKYNNRSLGVTEYPFTIVKLTDLEFSFLYNDISYVYKRIK